MNDKQNDIPDLIIAGAPKCGSSSLFFWLAAHPSICPSRKKETHFLRDGVNKHNKDLNIHENGIEAYSELFRNCRKDQLKLEATPRYLYEQTPIQVLAEKVPSPIIIFILREPADRTHSRYRFSRYRRKEFDMSFQDFLNAEAETMNWDLHPIEQSRYSKYLAAWVEAFGREKTKVFLFENMKRDPKGFMKKVASEIGIDPDFYEGYSFGQRNPSKKIRHKWLHSIGEKVQPMIPHRLQEWLLPLYMKLNSGKAPAPSKEELREKEQLRESFHTEKESLEKLFPELKFDAWDKQEN